MNYAIAKKDFFNPSVLFCAVNVASLVICFSLREMYSIELHGNTVLVLVSGVTIFTIFNTFCNTRLKRSYGERRFIKSSAAIEIREIRIGLFWVILLILAEVVVAYFMLSYIRRVATAYSGFNNIAIQIAVYNNLVKFNGETFRNLHIVASPIYTFGFPFCTAFCFLLMAVAVNNFFAVKKIEILYLLPSVLLMAMSLLTGSRSFAFTVITAVFIDFVIMDKRKRGRARGLSMKLFVRVVLLAVLVIIGLMYVTTVIGRGSQLSMRSFFAYFGAPIVNLDAFLQEHKLRQNTSPWGRETFYTLYDYIGSRFNIDSLVYDLTLPFRSRNGLNLGNVYTTYYQFIKDFGYIGVFSLITIIAIYFNYTYKLLFVPSRNRNNVSPRLIFYSLFFNDLLMLLFSNRFYESVFRARTIRMYIWFVVIWFFYKQGLFFSRIKKT